jgi:ABC-type Zn uptake system ZnuABC Zn-binding protein ZnuA
MRIKANTLFLAMALIFTLVVTVASNTAVKADETEKPIIVCTTNILGSLVEDFLGDQADVVVLAQPGICPADYDMKPSDIYAVSKAKLLFYHDIRGEYWLDNLIEASGNQNLTKVKIYGDWNTHEGAKRYIRWTGGNLSNALSVNLNATINSMIATLDAAAEEIKDEADALDVESFKVVCMNWQSPFVKWVGFDIIGEYGPPETLSAGFVANLTATAKKEGVALAIDNLQVGVDFGASLASEVGAVHVVLTNFPEAVPKTENFTQMFRYNAEQLFEGIRIWKTTGELIRETEDLKGQLAVFQSVTAIAIIVAVVEAVWLYTRRKKPYRRGGSIEK